MRRRRLATPCGCVSSTSTATSIASRCITRWCISCRTGKQRSGTTGSLESARRSLDSAGRLQHYSGARTTYKVEVDRLSEPPTIAPVAERFAALEKQGGGVTQLSVRDTARATIGAATITVDYGRPLARGRQLLGGVIPFGDVWRTGANAATQFTTSAPITLARYESAGGDVHAVDAAAAERRTAHRQQTDSASGARATTPRVTWAERRWRRTVFERRSSDSRFRSSRRTRSTGRWRWSGGRFAGRRRSKWERIWRRGR